MRILFLALILFRLTGCSQTGEPVLGEAASLREAPVPAVKSAVVCRDRNPLRNAYFGELHVHTGYSLDAYSFDTLTTPDDAYRFARGERIALAAGRSAQLERPLDFAAVTDHASTMGELRLCTDPESGAYESERCRVFRGDQEIDSPLGEMGARMATLMPGGPGVPLRSKALCGDDLERCRVAMDEVWADTQRSAERFQDRSSECRFTTFNGYEYTATPDLAKVHRNVVFRNEHVPKRVPSWVDVPDRWDLWRTLAAECLDAGTGCDVLTIPHNSNMSNGQMFAIDYRGEPLDVQQARAALWQRLEPLVEIMQTKGDSECRNGLWKVAGGRDPQCDFEKWRVLEPAPEPCRGGTSTRGMFGEGCQSRSDFVRYALVEGLREEARIGVNPIKLGAIASTDMHNSNPGDTAEASFDGVIGKDDATPAQRLSGPSEGIGPAPFNPGGLVGVWAEENTRDSLFDAMKRRETFATSGTRILPRFFGAWSWPEDLCERGDWLESADRGVAMGGDLPARPGSGSSPSFVVSALRDPGAPGEATMPLQKIQIIKAWPGEGEVMHQAVFDVAGDAESDASVDLDTCEATGRAAGHQSLCAVWSDPDFDPDAHAVYYARVIENPSCRWSTLECNRLPEKGRPQGCDDARVPKRIQERAWTSPIWYSPGA